MGPSSRLQQLDVLRFFALVLVLGRHLPPYDEALPAYVRTFTGYWTNCGWIGVDLFFVLSGFLISGLLFREYQRFKRIDYRRFFIRRGFKIFPSFYLFIAGVLYVQISNYNWNPQQTPYQLARELLFVQNYGPGLLAHTWSLGVEEQFYIFLPLVFAVAVCSRPSKDNPFSWLPICSLFVFFALLLARLLTAAYNPDADPYTHLFPTHLRLDSLLFGVLIAYYYHFHRDIFLIYARRYRVLLAIGGTLLLMPSLKSLTWFNYTFGFSLFYIGFGMILCLSLVLSLPTVGPISWIVRSFAFLGAHSYSIYLWHMPVKIWGPLYASRWFGLEQSSLHNLLVYIIGSFLIGIILSIAVEFPMLKIRDSLFPSRSQSIRESEDPHGKSIKTSNTSGS